MFRRFLDNALPFTIAAAVLVGPLYAAPLAQDSLLPVVKAVRADYPTPLGEEGAGAVVTRVASIGGPQWGVLLKDGGSRCPSSVGFISCDILVHIPTQQEYDILGDSDGLGIPAFDKLPFKCGVPPSGCDMARVRTVSSVPPTPTPDPVPPVPVPQPVDLTPILNRLAALEQAVNALKADISDIRSIIAALPPPGTVDCSKLPTYRGSAWFGTLTSRPQCK